MVVVIVTVRLHDITLVHHSVIVEDFQVDDEVDEDDEDDGKNMSSERSEESISRHVCHFEANPRNPLYITHTDFSHSFEMTRKFISYSFRNNS